MLFVDIIKDIIHRQQNKILKIRKMFKKIPQWLDSSINFTKKIYSNIMQGTKFEDFKFNDYLISIKPINDHQLSISILDYKHHAVYSENKAKVNCISIDLLKKALKNQHKDIKVAGQPDEERQPSLKITISINTQFLQNIAQVVYIKKTRDIQQHEIYEEEITKVQQKLKKIKEKLKTKTQLYSCTLQQKSFTNHNSQQISRILLNKGTYILTISFLVKAKSNFVYFSSSHIRINQHIPHQGFFCPPSSNYFAYKMKFLIDMTNKEYVRFNTINGDSYPTIFKNVIITAQKIQQ